MVVLSGRSTNADSPDQIGNRPCMLEQVQGGERMGMVQNDDPRPAATEYWQRVGASATALWLVRGRSGND